MKESSADELRELKLRDLRGELAVGEAQLARGEGEPADTILEQLEREYHRWAQRGTD